MPKIFQIMDRTGHSTLEFDLKSAVDIKAAMARFDALTASGHAAATRKTGETDYIVVKKFQDTQDETLFVPAMQGG